MSLYKNEKYNEALVAFSVAPVKDELKVEKDYYIALSHYKLNERKRAFNHFKTVGESTVGVALHSDVVVEISVTVYGETA